MGSPWFHSRCSDIEATYLRLHRRSSGDFRGRNLGCVVSSTIAHGKHGASSLGSILHCPWRSLALHPLAHLPIAHGGPWRFILRLICPLPMEVPGASSFGSFAYCPWMSLALHPLAHLPIAHGCPLSIVLLPWFPCSIVGPI
jgi:hypothetical protein